MMYIMGIIIGSEANSFVHKRNSVFRSSVRGMHQEKRDHEKHENAKLEKFYKEEKLLYNPEIAD